MVRVFRPRRYCALAIAAACLVGGPAAAEQLTIVTNDGRGGGYRKGGTYKAVAVGKFASTDTLGYRVLSGTFRYWAIHARYNGGVWQIVYKGPRNNIPMADIQRKIAALRRGRPTHLNFSVNGAHERYDRVACRLAIVRRGGRVHTLPARGGINVVAGTYGQNCGTRRGNKTAHLRQVCQGRARCVYTIDYKVIGDPRRGCAKNYIAEWRCAGSSAIRRLVATPEAGYRKRLTLSCQGRNGLTRPPAAHLPGQVGVVLNNGRGGRKGGTYKAFPYGSFGNHIGYRVLSGTFRYWTIHARYKSGIWKIVYKGRRNNIPMGVIQRKVAALRRGHPTHLNISVNGAHEHYDRVACRLAIMGRGRAHTPPPRRGGAIHVVAGTYGQNCGTRRGNKTAHLRRVCQGRTRCVYTIDHKVIGDPRYGCAKNYIAEWRCSGSSAIRRLVATPEAGYRKKLTLSCQ